jgi:hypothetical protein
MSLPPLFGSWPPQFLGFRKIYVLGGRNVYHQPLLYADNVDILGGNLHTIKKNTEASVVASKETGLEVNVDKTKYVIMSRD